MHASDLFEKVTAELVAAIEAGARGFQMPGTGWPLPGCHAVWTVVRTEDGMRWCSG